MRASALAFGVLQELARQPILWEGKQMRLLDELDVVQGISGGSFTAAYYALKGDGIFQDFESRFLSKNWESELKSRIFWSPKNWFRLWSPYFGRAHLLSELLDEALFEGHTFGDLHTQRRRPFLFVQATDMATMSPFAFEQGQFDPICSDISKFRIADATAASAALPLMLSAVTLKNYAGTCGFQLPAHLPEAMQMPGQHQRIKEDLSYLDQNRRPYVHLLDGGLADNIGMRNVLDAIGPKGGGLEQVFRILGFQHVQKLVFIVVNAERNPELADYRLAEIPSLRHILRALIDIPQYRYSADTIQLTRLAIKQRQAELRQRHQEQKVIFAEDAEVYFITVSLNDVRDPDERAFLQSIDTTLYLTDEQRTRLIRAAAVELQHDEDFQRLMEDLQDPSGK